MASKPTKTQAANAARAFIRFLDKNHKTTQADMLMNLGRLYEFPEGTPKFDGPWNARSVAAFIEYHAVEIE